MVRAKRKIRFKLFILLPIILMTFNCAKKQLLKPYEFEDYVLPAMPRLAMMPLENFSTTERAGKKVGDIFLVEFLKMKNIYLIEPGNVEVALAEERVRNISIMPVKTINALANKLNVDLIMIGSVMGFEMQQSTGGGGAIPLISLTVRVLDVKTGNIVWAVNTIRRGDDKEKLFGVGRILSIDKLAEIIAEEISYEFSNFIKKHAK